MFCICLTEKRLALLGSSHVSRFPESVLQDLDYRVIKKFGVPGVKTTGIREKLLDEVSTFQPNVCFIMLGGNDLDSHPDNLNLKTVVDNFMRIVNSLQDNGIRMVVSEVFYRGEIADTSPQSITRSLDLQYLRGCVML